MTDLKKRNKTINKFLPLISRISSRYNYWSRINKHDLMNQGVLALIRAIEKFDIKKSKNKNPQKAFLNYLYRIIHHELQSYVGKEYNSFSGSRRYFQKYGLKNQDLFPYKRLPREILEKLLVKSDLFDYLLIKDLKIQLKKLSQEEQDIIKLSYLYPKKSEQYKKLKKLIGVSDSTLFSRRKKILKKLNGYFNG